LNNDFVFDINTLHRLFVNGFTDAYRDAPTHKRRKLMPYAMALHRRWYYSALIENTPVTPANIVDSMAHYYNEGTDIFPHPVLKNASRFSGFSVTLARHDSAHPVIGDLGLLLDFCSPHADIDGEDLFFNAQLLALSERISIGDPAYAAFLLDVALEMKLMVKVPSLHVNRIMCAKDARERLAAEPTAFFAGLVESAVLVCAKRLRIMIELPENVFTDSYVRAMLTDPVETDAVFERVYDTLGYTLEDLTNLSLNPQMIDFGSEDEAFLAGTFMMGLVLDQYFYTPFGYFLKLIKPHYVLPFVLNTEIEDFMAAPLPPPDEEVFMAYFAPCSSYTLTELGLRTLNIKKTEKNYFDAADYIPFDLLKETLFSDPEMIEILVKMVQIFPPLHLMEGLPPSEVYAFRIRLKDEPSLWLHLHMPPDATLNDFYDEILDFLPLRDSGDFSFFHDPTENRFAEYPCAKRAKPNAKKTAEAVLSSFDFERQSLMLMTIYGQALPFAGKSPARQVEIEMTGIKEADVQRDYPYVARMSTALKKSLEAENE